MEATCPHCGKSPFIDPTYYFRSDTVGGVTTCGWYCSPRPFLARTERYAELRRDAAARKLRPYSSDEVEAVVERCIKRIDRRLKKTSRTDQQLIRLISRVVAWYRRNDRSEEADEVREEAHWHILKHYNLYQQEVL